jgi:hypothetical protein
VRPGPWLSPPVVKWSRRMAGRISAVTAFLPL